MLPVAWMDDGDCGLTRDKSLELLRLFAILAAVATASFLELQNTFKL